MSQYFPKPYESFGRDINVTVDLSNYATKADIENITHVDTLRFGLKTNLANLKNDVDKLDIDKLKNLPNNLSSLKTKVDKLDIDKLIPVPVDLSKLSSVPKNEVVKKTDFDNKLLSLNRKIVSNKAKDLLIESKLKKLKAFDSNYYHDKNYFDEDGIQNYLVFQSILKYFTVNSSWITKWESKGLSNESLEVVSTSSNTLTPSVNYYREKARLKFTGSVLQQKIVTYRHRKVINLYVVYEITNFHDIDNYPTLTNSLFGAVKLTKNADIDKY